MRAAQRCMRANCSVTAATCIFNKLGALLSGPTKLSIHPATLPAPHCRCDKQAAGAQHARDLSQRCRGVGPAMDGCARMQRRHCVIGQEGDSRQ